MVHVELPAVPSVESSSGAVVVVLGFALHGGLCTTGAAANRPLPPPHRLRLLVFAGKNNPIYRFDSRGAKEYPQDLTMELSIPLHLRYTYLQQDINNNCDMEVMVVMEIVVVR